MRKVKAVSTDKRASDHRGLIGWILAGTFVLICIIAGAGIAQQRMDLTAVALSLVAFMGVLVRELLGKREDDDR